MPSNAGNTNPIDPALLADLTPEDLEDFTPEQLAMITKHRERRRRQADAANGNTAPSPDGSNGHNNSDAAPAPANGNFSPSDEPSHDPQYHPNAIVDAVVKEFFDDDNGTSDGESSTPTPDDAEEMLIPGFTAAELRKLKLDLNKKIKYESITDRSSGKRVYIITNQVGMEHFIGYMLLKQALPAHELQGAKFAAKAVNYIKHSEGCFLLATDGKYHIILHGRRIPIAAESKDFQAFFKDACKITTLSPEARMAVQHLDIHAHKQASKMVMRGFSAMYQAAGGWDSRVYVPISEEGKILCISPSRISPVPNGNNIDQLWLEHPKQNPFTWCCPADLAEVRGGLRVFEECLVNHQACKVPEMAWFVAMAEGLFPIVRDVTENRFLMLHIGEKGHGKTFAAKQSMLLHGFDDVTFDPSIAALDNQHEQGMVVLDNKENANFTTDVIDWLLRMATGGDRLRSDQHRNVHYAAPRPIVAFTSIEGPPKDELKDRCLYVNYWLAKDTPRLDEDAYQKAIGETHRDQIMSALACVVQDYLSVRTDPRIKQWLEGFRPIDRFNRHFWEVCYLLIAYARIMRRDTDYDYTAADDWAMEHIRVWDREIRRARGADAGGTADAEVHVSSYEDPILYLIQERRGEPRVYADWEYPKGSGHRGALYAFITSALHGALVREKLPNLQIPSDVSQFGARIRGERFQRFQLLTESDGVPGHARGQRIGIWIPQDEETPKAE